METFDDMNILIVDDEEDIRLIITELLKPLGAHIFEAGNGRLALEILSKERIDLAILDIKMPEMDGIDLLRHMAHTHPNIVSIMLTAYGGKEQVKAALKMNAFDFLEKPIEELVLVNRVVNGLHKSKNKKLLDMIIEEFLLESCTELTPAQFANMKMEDKNRVLSAGLTLIKIKNIKRSAA